MSVTVTRAKNSKENLCDFCRKSPADCDADKAILEYGDGLGNDNIIACDAIIYSSLKAEKARKLYAKM